MRFPKAALVLLTTAVLAVAAKPRPRFRAQRVVRISRVVSDLDRSETFYRDALGFRTISRGQTDQTTLLTLGLGDAEAREVVMQLGATTIALVCFRHQGQPYPADSQSNDLWFQHLAIVVSDVDAAYAHLTLATLWQPISSGGPQQLPPSNGGVRAFKFRDPDGHPLELIWFPPRGHDGVQSPAGQPAASNPLFLTVDHSALSISSTARAVNFYRGLGFHVTHRSVNYGPAQNRLDGLPAAHVRVTSLRPGGKTGPGLELLGYRPPGRQAGMTRLNNMATDWVTVQVTTLFGDRHRALRDPDGHRLLLVDQGSGLPA